MPSNAVTKAGAAFLTYRLPSDLYWLDGFYACNDGITRYQARRYSWSDRSRAMHVELTRLNRE
jgi:hypothetical protein